MGQKILYCVGLRGEDRKLREVVAACEEGGIDRLILAGDCFPDSNASEDGASAQLDFLEGSLAPFLEDLIDRTKARVLIHPGPNDLRYPTLEDLRTWTGRTRARVVIVDDGRYNTVLGKPLLAYPYVPPSPGSVKDWEKWDDAHSGGSIPETFVKGVQSARKGLTPVLLSPSHAGDTIAGDLAARELGMHQIEFLLLANSPPQNTALDLADEDTHIGSHAVRGFIERTQPLLSLHAQTLEAPRHVGGAYFCRIGKTLCINPGQSEEGEPVRYLSFDLSAPVKTMAHSHTSLKPPAT